ncbi:MAG: EAL domain-containing protein [Nitrosomonadales bacterium]|nr:EAL domain-containing protein [Nitrosomonadales bacterium]
MTLFKQLFVAVSLGFLFLLAGIEAIYIGNARVYLQEQLASHSQDAATSLGMVLPAAMDGGDAVRAETTVAAVFDRGFYRSIRVISPQGKTVVIRELSPAPPDVPQWFAFLIRLEAPSAESMISRGWRQLGRVIVTSHPNFAYRQLWRTTWETTFWLAGLYLACLALLSGFLKTVLRPLEEIESVANAISERDFRLVAAKPGTRELDSVVQAINSLSGNIRRIIGEEAAKADHSRAEAYKDPLTKLDNRRSFELQVAPVLTGADTGSGVLYLVQAARLKKHNAIKGFKSGDELLTLIGATLCDVWADRNSIRARILGSTFAVAAFNLSRMEAFALGREISDRLNRAIEAGGYAATVGKIGCGGAYFSESARPPLGNLLATADLAMLQSLHRADAAPILLDFKPSSDDEKGSQFWKALIAGALAADRIALLAQPVIAFQDNTRLQYEIMGRLIGEDGELIAAGRFMPMAVRHGLAAAVDKKLIGKAFRVLLEKQHLADQFAINLSARSISDPELLEWLFPALESQPGMAQRIVFEFAEFGVVQELPALEKFASRARKLGVRFAVDGFGLHGSAFEYLLALRPEYIKLNPAFIEGLPDSRENQFFISSVTHITRSLGIKTFAHAVENADLFDLLEKLGVDGYQGFATGAPTRIG